MGKRGPIWLSRFEEMPVEQAKALAEGVGFTPPGRRVKGVESEAASPGKFME
jgi:hypothetical protein